jgi:hypothetical protein
VWHLSLLLHSQKKAKAVKNNAPAAVKLREFAPFFAKNSSQGGAY